jgi:hypothetical protein
MVPTHGLSSSSDPRRVQLPGTLSVRPRAAGVRTPDSCQPAPDRPKQAKTLLLIDMRRPLGGFSSFLGRVPAGPCSETVTGSAQYLAAAYISTSSIFYGAHAACKSTRSGLLMSARATDFSTGRGTTACRYGRFLFVAVRHAQIQGVKSCLFGGPLSKCAVDA